MKYWQKAIKTKLLYFLLAIVIGQICPVANVMGQNFNLRDNRKKDVISFELINNLIIIPVYINNKGPFNFILDTGVGPMVITNPALRDSLGLTDPRQVKISGFGVGEEIFAYVTKSSIVTIGDSFAENISTFVLKEDLFNLSSYVGKDISGLIGYDFFSNFIVKINYPSQKLTFSIHNQRNSKINGERIPITLINNKPYVDAEIQTIDYGKIGVKLIIDCGASHAISLETYEGNVFQPSAVNIQGNLGVGLSGQISGHIGRTPSLTLGPFIFKDVLTSFPTPYEVGAKTSFKERNGNLGAEILKRFHVTFDYQNNAMYLQKNEFYNRPFEHDMAGIELHIGTKPYQAYFVGRIEPGSPAEKSDFHAGDQILSINFKKIDEYTFDQINEVLKSGNGRTLVIELMRDKKLLVKLLKLRKRI